MASIKNNLGRFRVSGELLRECLAMPDEVKIIRVQADPIRADTFEFVVDYEGFSECKPGLVIPEYSPVITVDYDKKPSSWLTFDFGDPV